MYSTLFSCTKLVAANYIMDRLSFEKKCFCFVLFCSFFPPFHTSTDCGKIIYVVIHDVIHDVRPGLSKMVLVDNRLQKSFKIKPDSFLRCRIWQIQEFLSPLSDQHQSCSSNMNSQSTEKVTSIIKMVTKGKCSLHWFFKENYGDQSREFEWILGLQGYDLEKKFDRCLAS